MKVKDNYESMIKEIYPSVVDSVFRDLNMVNNFEYESNVQLGGTLDDLVDDIDVNVQKLPQNVDAFCLEESKEYRNLLKKMDKRETYISRLNLSYVEATRIFSNQRLTKKFFKKVLTNIIKKYNYNGEKIIGPAFLSVTRPGTGDILRDLENAAGYELRIYSDFYYEN